MPSFALALALSLASVVGTPVAPVDDVGGEASVECRIGEEPPRENRTGQHGTDARPDGCSAEVLVGTPAGPVAFCARFDDGKPSVDLHASCGPKSNI